MTLLSKKTLLMALQKKETVGIPFWFMRQAGRYLPEYRELRKKAGSFLDLCYNPDFATEVTLQPLRRFDMDAAIMFSDILVVPDAMGQKLSFVEGEGPRLETDNNFNRFNQIDTYAFDQKLAPVYQTIKNIKNALLEEKALIGFAGAPWTIACYMIQGRGDGEFLQVQNIARDNPAEFQKLIDALVTATSRYLIKQIESGVDTVQIFDSWAGVCPDFDRWVITPTKKIVDHIHQIYPDFPVIGFPRQANKNYLSYAAHTGIAGIGVDQGHSIKSVLDGVNGKTTVQGNLDPEILLAGGEKMESAAKRIMESAANRPFIFNLGHGVIKETPPAHVERLSNIIKAWKK